MKSSQNFNRRSLDRRRINLRLEPLDGRCLLSISSVASLPALMEVEPNDVLGQSLDLGSLRNQSLTAEGAIGDGVRFSSDVDWYSFKLDEASDVVLSAINSVTGDRFGGIISLYNEDPFSFSDPASAAGVRLLSQTVPSSGTGAIIEKTLAAGIYYFALSGAGNPDFHPYLADSGLPGLAEDYQVSVTATSLKLDSVSGPQIITSQPAANAEMSSSPLVIRVQFSAPLDPSSVIADNSISLFKNSTGDFKSYLGQQVFASWVNFSTQAGELQFAPSSALEPGFYHLVLHGDASTGQSILTDAQGVPLGCDASHSTGQDFEINFRVTAIEEGMTPNDSAGTAYQLGDLVANGAIRVAGAIGDDPTQNPNDPVTPTSPGADVDLYRFQVTGPGLFQLTAEVFAGRIGSRLDPGISLFQLDPRDGQLRLVTANEDTQNSVTSTNGMVPLYTDPVLYAGLTAGEYFLAVSARNNTPDPALGQEPGKDGVFDPNIPHSGLNGSSVGDYVLSANLQIAEDAPEVISSTIEDGSQLESPPTDFAVEFSSTVNLRQISLESFNQPTPGELQAVFLQGPNGSMYFPRLTDFDPETGMASFLMLDRLPEGDYELHLSGSHGLKDLADQELLGNDPSGDFVIRFHVSAALPGVGDDPLVRVNEEPNDSKTPQDLGILFPRELQSGVAITRTASNTIDTGDVYRFEVLQSKPYVFNLDQTGLKMQLVDEFGNAVAASVRDTGDSLQAELEAGVYFLRVEGWTESESQSLAYTLRMVLGTSSDNPPPLAIGPRPASIANLASLQNSIRGETPQPVNPPESIAPPDSNSPSELPPSSDGYKMNGGQQQHNENSQQHKPAETVTKTDSLTLPTSSSNGANANFNASVMPSQSSTQEVTDGCGRNGVSESSTPTQSPFVTTDEPGISEWRASTELASVQGSSSKTNDRVVLPVSLLFQWRAEPVSGVQFEEESTPFVSPSLVKSDEVEIEETNESRGTIKSSMLEAESSGWIRNISSAMLLMLVGGTGMARHILSRRTRTNSKANLLRSPELIQIGR